jgi:hypothetical protein
MGQAKRRFMEEEARGWSHTGKHVCASCLTAPPLQAAIKNKLIQGQSCDFCEAKHAASLDVLMEEHIMPAIFEQYNQAGNELHYENGEYDGDPPDTHDFIEDLFFKTEASSCTALIDEIKNSIEFTNWCKIDYYGMTSDEVRLFFWHKFSEVVKHSNRYFFADAVLGEDIDNPNKTTTHFLSDLKTIIEAELLTPLPGGIRFHRARIGSERYSTLTELGAPPYKTATHANRMSPAGVSMLYGAFDGGTAKCEVGPLNNDQFVSLALIATTRDTRVIDFCKLPEPPSFFELGQRERRFLCNFLHDFVKDLRAPVEKDGREHIDYVPTQVLTEFLKSSMPIDGMIFPSAKREGGQCIVLWGNDFVPYLRDAPVAIELTAVEHFQGAFGVSPSP